LSLDKLWFSYYKNLNDPTEFEIDYKIKKIVSRTAWKKQSIETFVSTIQQMYDVCSFTYKLEEYVWEEYGGDGNGICMVFDVLDYDYT